MKKSWFLAAASIGAVALTSLAACGNNKTTAADSDTAEVVDMVAAVEQAIERGDTVLKTYTAAWFEDDANRASADKAGWVQTPSGLRYVMVAEGTGAQPVETSSVRVNYSGVLADGTMFDSSWDHGAESGPIVFPLNHVIPAWTEGVQLMKEGGQAVLYAPANLAYGERGAGDLIPPGATLVFYVDLLNIIVPEAQ